MKSVCPPKREPWAKRTPWASVLLDVDVGQDLVGAATDVDRFRLRHFRRAREVDVGLPLRLHTGALHRRQLERRAVVEREHVVLAGLVEPQLDHLLELLGVLRTEVVRLGAV